MGDDTIKSMCRDDQGDRADPFPPAPDSGGGGGLVGQAVADPTRSGAAGCVSAPQELDEAACKTHD